MTPTSSLWSGAFDLARRLFPIAARAVPRGYGLLNRRLIAPAIRIAVVIGRRHGAGRSLPAADIVSVLSDLTEIETRLLLGAETGILRGEVIAPLVLRIAGMRALLGEVPRETPAPGGPPGAGPPDPIRPPGSVRAAQRGAALVIALLLGAVLSAAGLVLLMTAEVETLLAARSADREQLMHAAESGARMVKRWFDAPVSGNPASPRHAFLGQFDLRDPSPFHRGARTFDHDADPATAEVRADGRPGREQWRQGREVAPPAPHLDLFHPPWSGSPTVALLGSRLGPDLILADSAGRDLLDDLNHAILGDQARAIRVHRIAVFAPPRHPSTDAPLGIATIEVQAARYRRLDRGGPVPIVIPGDVPVARAAVRFGLTAILRRPPAGPLAACGNLTVMGRLRARWGRVSAAGGMRLADEGDALDRAVASGWPFAAPGRRISGDATAAWIEAAGGLVEDPWIEVHVGGTIAGLEDRPDQPLPHDASIDPSGDHSNLFQRSPAGVCPPFAYHEWKRIALSGLTGEEGPEYFSFDAATGLFRRWGEGPARSVRDWTHGREGIFFFDTADRRPPGPLNLTPPVAIEGVPWHTAGILVLHAASFSVHGARGTPRIVIPPGEPCDDACGMHLNLDYPAPGADPEAPLFIDPSAAATWEVADPEGEVYRVVTTPGRDARGHPLLVEINVFGILYNAGDFVAEGDAVHYGAVIAGGDVVQPTPGADSPVILYDARLAAGTWPPPEIAMPRTRTTFWHASAP